MIASSKSRVNVNNNTIIGVSPLKWRLSTGKCPGVNFSVAKKWILLKPRHLIQNCNIRMDHDIVDVVVDVIMFSNPQFASGIPIPEHSGYIFETLCINMQIRSPTPKWKSVCVLGYRSCRFIHSRQGPLQWVSSQSVVCRE